MTSRAFALTLGCVVTTAPAQVLSPPIRDADARPTIMVAAAPATTETGTGFPAAALLRLTQFLARPNAIEIRKIVLEFFDSGMIGPSKIRALKTYFTKHSEQLEDLRLELKTFQELSRPNKYQKDAAHLLVLFLQNVQLDAKIVEAEEGAAKAKERADKSQARAAALSRFSDLLAPNKYVGSISAAHPPAPPHRGWWMRRDQPPRQARGTVPRALSTLRPRRGTGSASDCRRSWRRAPDTWVTPPQRCDQFLSGTTSRQDYATYPPNRRGRP